jgi:tRNA threonylcarbamoyladenosine biosynthesis protein TsaE
METLTQNAKETKELGREVGNNLKNKLLNKPSSNGALVLALTGDLGSGKTTFIQGLADGLGIKQRIISPTFIIIRSYNMEHKTKKEKPTSEVRRLKTFYHIDLYRLEENVEREMKNLGIDEIMSDPLNILAIEWAEKAKDYLPKNTKWIKFEYVNENKRRITVTS